LGGFGEARLEEEEDEDENGILNGWMCVEYMMWKGVKTVSRFPKNWESFLWIWVKKI